MSMFPEYVMVNKAIFQLIKALVHLWLFVSFPHAKNASLVLRNTCGHPGWEGITYESKEIFNIL